MEITLRPFSKDDVKSLESWISGDRVAPYMSRWTPRTASGWHYLQDLCRWHVIVANYRSVGMIWIEREHAEDRVADLGILIGEPDDRGHGVGTTAIRIAERDAFESWGIGKVRLRVRASNSTAIGCYERSGFIPVNKSTKTIEGEVVDVIHMEHLLAPGETTKGEQDGGGQPATRSESRFSHDYNP